MESDDPRLLLARRLRALREERWPDIKITQLQLAQALGGTRPLSVPLISSWESKVSPAIPPLPRLEGYAVLFASRRSFGGADPHLISLKDMSEEERQATNELRQELVSLRNRAIAAGHLSGLPGAENRGSTAWPSTVPRPLPRGPWHFEDGSKITIVCAQWPPEMLSKIPYTDVNEPDYIELLTYSELDALVMSYGHLRAANPSSEVEYFRSGLLPPANYSSHLVSLGGTDWNVMTASLLKKLGLPVKQVADWDKDDGQFFEVEEDAGNVRHRAILEEVGGGKILREDVALFAQAINPFNQNRSATICCGMYGRGTYGVVRALTDPEFRDRNTMYLQSRFGESRSYCLVIRVPVENNNTLTPDWTQDDTRLFEWSDL